MNLLDTLDNDLKNKHYNNFEKVRYIYLKTCELFYFDARYYFVEQFNKKLYKKIINREIDITKVDEFSVICHSYSKCLFSLINELTTANVSLRLDGHSLVEYEDDSGANWFLDATLGDLSRIKVGIRSNGFTCRESWNINYQDDLDLIDESFGYTIKERKDYLNLLDLTSFNNFINGINDLLKEKNLNNIADAFFLVKWLLYGTNYVFSDCFGMDIKYNSYGFFYNDINELFCLSQENCRYGIKEVSFDEGLQLSKKLHMNSRNFFNNNG